MHSLESHHNPETAEALNQEQCGYEHDQGRLIHETS